ncbi:MAG TPA: RNA methyltransferase [Jatrophihabitans sp.]|nr:RNA methyltransferase [Jatrophihabitans sp.]
MQVVTSAANPVVKRVRLLADRKHRRRQNAFVVEGLQPVWRAVSAGRHVETLIVAPELLANPAAGDMVAELERDGVEVIRVSAELFRRLSDRDGPAGLAAIVTGGVGTLDDLAVQADSVFVVLHELSNPGNIGTLVRTVDAAGAHGVILLGHTADPLSAPAIKASMGSVFAVPVTAVAGEDELLGWAGRHGLRLAAMTGAGAVELWQAELPRPLLVLLGNEGAGLPDSLLAAADLRVRIPMTGTAESLNVAAAGAVVLYELARRAQSG